LSEALRHLPSSILPGSYLDIEISEFFGWENSLELGEVEYVGGFINPKARAESESLCSVQKIRVRKKS
jgi:hypothetical protein